MSPTTTALCTSEPFPPRLPFSTNFFALSQAPPALAMVSANRTQPSRAPPSIPPSAAGPSKNPTTGGAPTASTPGAIIRFRAAVVAISIHRLESGCAVPSISPGISLNCRRISRIMSNAASPTAVIVILLTRNGNIPPRNIPASTVGSLISNLKSGTW